MLLGSLQQYAPSAVVQTYLIAPKATAALLVQSAIACHADSCMGYAESFKCPQTFQSEYHREVVESEATVNFQNKSCWECRDNKATFKCRAAFKCRFIVLNPKP